MRDDIAIEPTYIDGRKVAIAQTTIAGLPIAGCVYLIEDAPASVRKYLRKDGKWHDTLFTHHKQEGYFESQEHALRFLDALRVRQMPAISQQERSDA